MHSPTSPNARHTRRVSASSSIAGCRPAPLPTPTPHPLPYTAKTPRYAKFTKGCVGMPRRNLGVVGVPWRLGDEGPPSVPSRQEYPALYMLAWKSRRGTLGVPMADSTEGFAVKPPIPVGRGPGQRTTPVRQNGTSLTSMADLLMNLRPAPECAGNATPGRYRRIH